MKQTSILTAGLLCWAAFSGQLQAGVFQIESPPIPAKVVKAVVIEVGKENNLREQDPKEQDQADQNSTNQEEDESSQTDESSVISTAEYVGQTGQEIGERTIRFHLWNGLIIGGDLEVDSINIETEFGPLKVPIDRIMKFYPGLDSFPELNSKIDSLVEALGDKNFEIRENSHNELVRMGSLLQTEIYRFDDAGSVERKKHLAEIKKKIEELADDDLENESKPQALVRGDRIETPEFTIVGKIVQSEFDLNSKYGKMKVQLADIQMADRTYDRIASEIRRNLTIDAMDFFPEGKSTKIRVKRGDKIKVLASGSVNWVNWNTSCGPDGMSDKGQFRGHPSGMLLARIGEKEDYIKIGSEGSFVAPSSGVLYLGIGIADNYARNTGYRWTGEYKARILIQPTLETDNR